MMMLREKVIISPKIVRLKFGVDLRLASSTTKHYNLQIAAKT